MTKRTARSTKHSFFDDLVTLWPGLPYLGLGVWLAWALLAYSGAVWLSDVEMDGTNLATMFLISTGACAVVLLLAPFFHRPYEFILQSRACLLGAGIFAALGALCIILSGPYYTAIVPLFWIGDTVTGIGTGFLALKCGQLYGELTPQKALLYASLSQITVVILYFFVIGNEVYFPIVGGPSLGGILALVGLPVVLALLVSLKPTKAAAEGNADARAARMGSQHNSRALPPVYWKFLFAILVFTIATSTINGLSISLSPPSSILNDSNTLMLLRVIVSVVFFFLAIRAIRHIDFGKLYLLIMVLIAVAVVVMPLLDLVSGPLGTLIAFFSKVFDFITWCLFAFIMYQKKLPAPIIFGFGRGVFMAGTTLGWFLGVRIMPLLMAQGWDTFVYVVFALLILVSATLIFSEKDFARLFSPISELELILDEIPLEGSTEKDEGEDQRNPNRPYLTACKQVAAEARLSAREQDVFEQLALGRGSENIAKRLSISLNTARTHTHNVYAKLDVHSRQELIELVESKRAEID
ncbi:MAG: LuxR C-terminal-related transcriptional regulator [Coriobacteriales bacterium]|jgi:DNA-binding CsgD family transcriptional regulator|nr:LuxR C-terminal-related transcriptional regulator [Coriobacteriales bacterium]